MAGVTTPRLPGNGDTPFDRDLVRMLTAILNDHARAINRLAAGSLAGVSATSSAIPTVPGVTGDVVRNTAPLLSGGAVVWGWMYYSGAWHPISFASS